MLSFEENVSSETPVAVQDKRVINGRADVNQLVPIKYQWAWEKYRAQNANHWLPQEVQMSRDIAQWRGGSLTDAERLVVERNLGFFVTADSLAANNIVLGTYRNITAPECRQFLLRQAYDEAIHTEAYQYIVESLGLDESRVFGAYLSIPSIQAKDEFLLPHIRTLENPAFKTGTPETDAQFLRSVIVFAAIMEGLFFYVGFSQILAMGRQNKMPGASEQYQYILRDESNHCDFGITMANQIKMENPQLWTESFRKELLSIFEEGIRLECAYADDTMPSGGFLGFPREQYQAYVRFIAARRLTQLGLPTDIAQAPRENPFPWLSESIDLRKEKNFFETRVTEYQTGGSLTWD
ncbi:ribonucleotide-diphosphate reductase subunit beta [Acidithiobacillus sp. M4-SHS-6]|uniref:ribonucleotide-diphosphate reductase subunit beta n=1 Tax=Acidithiobacillus sp. M4-SHS-6 TaxID=3383024 RepID=UPI0039BE4FE9